jgi:hypothetical protein
MCIFISCFTYVLCTNSLESGKVVGNGRNDTEFILFVLLQQLNQECSGGLDRTHLLQLASQYIWQNIRSNLMDSFLWCGASSKQSTLHSQWQRGPSKKGQWKYIITYVNEHPEWIKIQRREIYHTQQPQRNKKNFRLKRTMKERGMVRKVRHITGWMQ